MNEFALRIDDPQKELKVEILGHNGLKDEFNLLISSLVSIAILPGLIGGCDLEFIWVPMSEQS